jgi:SAM-dependent methyltransferase
LNDRTTYLPAIKQVSTGAASTTCPRGLEVGCGAGAFSRRAKELGWNMHAIEPSASAAALARESGVQVFHGTLDEFKENDHSFDAIFAWMVLEHLPFPKVTLSQFHKWLVPDGWLCLSVPNHRSLDRWLFGSKWIGYDGPRHLQQFEPRRLEKLLIEIGFSEVVIHYQPNLQYWFGSIAALLHGKQLLDNERRWKIRDRFWMRQFHDGLSFPLRIALSPLANGLSALGISGRITVLARKKVS